jgi:hypothetical protein
VKSRVNNIIDRRQLKRGSEIDGDGSMRYEKLVKYFDRENLKNWDKL